VDKSHGLLSGKSYSPALRVQYVCVVQSLYAVYNELMNETISRGD